jgi:hypothetical protein
MYVHYEYLIKARHDDLMRAAARSRRAAGARRARRSRRHAAITVPARRLARLRQRILAA